jgi:NAD(P)H-dependent flavin oxidoreductase YrpB (nitropropane dioxygenase family)
MEQRLRSPLCELLGIPHPILSAGIGSGARAELVAAVSNAGGFGVLGASGLSPDALGGEVERTQTLTDRPFGINIILAGEAQRDVERGRAFVRAQIAAAAAAGASAVVLFWGDPEPFVASSHAAGVSVLIQVGSVAEAEIAVSAGVDAVIAQGCEAGGHVRGTTSIWDLVPATIKAVSVPVVASGGIGNGAGLARALRLGAQGVSLGTRFVASKEANLHPDYKRRIVAAGVGDTVYTQNLYDGHWPDAPHRTLRNRAYMEWQAAGQPLPGHRPGEGTSIGHRTLTSGERVEWPRYAIGTATPDFDGDLDLAPLWAGESCAVIRDIKPAAQIITDLINECRVTLDSTSTEPAR